MKNILLITFCVLASSAILNTEGYSYIYDLGHCLKSGETSERVVLRQCKMTKNKLVGFLTEIDEACPDSGLKVFCAYEGK